MSSLSISIKRRASKKRKRRPSLPKAEQSSDTDGVFHSQSSHKAAQLKLAGASDPDHDPTLEIPNFPHRGFGRRDSSSEPDPEAIPDEEENLVTQEGARRGKPRPRENDRKGHLDTLLRAIEQFLDQGEIRKAARAYGVVLQLRPRSLPIDVRSYNIWAMGAEILMRQGEEQLWQRIDPADESGYDGPGGSSSARGRPLRRWGSAANMGRVRAYFETLMRQFPYDRRHPNLVSAVDFWLALLSCEVYNTHAEYIVGLAELDDDEFDREVDERHDEDTTYYDGNSEDRSLLRDGAYFGHLGDLGSYPSPRKSTVGKRKDNVRMLALESMRDIIQRLEKLMEDSPYTKNEHFLRLRATASLFAADLCMPLWPALPMQLRQAETRRALEQRAALDAIRELMTSRADNATPAADVHFETYYLREEHATSRPANLYSSLPIRE